jgi:hypothetical protein
MRLRFINKLKKVGVHSKTIAYMKMLRDRKKINWKKKRQGVCNWHNVPCQLLEIQDIL